MSALHEALSLLARVDWNDVPQTDLSSYLSKHFNAGELLCNSVPLPPNGTPFESSQPHFETPNAARSAKDIHPSDVRPRAPHDDHASFQKSWGKPMKFSQKENPLQVSLYKMAGHDRHGSWFARHSILEGMSFSKFKKAMLREFPETLLTQGAPGVGAIRGLSAERRLERLDAASGDRVEVYQLSAQMPSPVTPREFLTLFLTTDQGLTDKSPTGEQSEEKYIPRHFMVVSRALNHPDAPQRSNFVRASYESVELMREIPLHTVTKTDPELNPVEWIMVTRSDPAGGIPRFLIDRGTPGAMLTDVSKFLNWACGQEDITDPDSDLERQKSISADFEGGGEPSGDRQVDQAAEENKGTSEAPLDKAAEQVNHNNSAQQEVSRHAANTAVYGDSTQDTPELTESRNVPTSQGQPSGMLGNMSSTLQAGINAYAPTSVSNYMNKETATDAPADDRDDSSSDISSDDSFMSAEELRRLSTAPEPSKTNNSENMSIRSAASSVTSTSIDKKNMNRHDKEVLSILRRREKLDEKIAKKREAEEAKLQASQEKDQTEQDKARERMEKEMKKTQDRHQKEVEKLEAKRQKEFKKAEERRKKKDEQSKLSYVARERDDLRSQADLLRRENSLLADQVENLQRENTALVTKLGKLNGPEAVKSLQEEMKQSGSIKSGDSRLSLESGGSTEKKELKETTS